MRARKIVICFDGTGNEVGDNETNVLKLYKGLSTSQTSQQEQIVHYVPGIGTMDGPRLFGSTLRRKTKAVLGLAFGMGLEDDVLDAYRFLCRTYQNKEAKKTAADAKRSEVKALAKTLGLEKPPVPTRFEAEDDRIYIFGFSRGAYAARILAGFINNFGLVPPERLHMIAEVFRAYRAITEKPGDATDSDDTGKDTRKDTPDDAARKAENARVFKKMRQFGDVLDPDRSVSIQALCLFDTVASMARFNRPLASLWSHRSPMQLGTHANVMKNPSVRIVVHALALDERRSMFRALPWIPGPYYGNRFANDEKRRQQYVEQSWFPGYHSDIGGSPREYFSGIGKITLLWMLDRLKVLEKAAWDEDQAADPVRGDMKRFKPQHGLRLKKGYRSGYLEGGAKNRRTPAGERFARPDALAPTHPSMAPGWWPLEVLPKTTKRKKWPGRRGFGWYIPWGEPRVIPEDHNLHESVHERMRRWKFYRPVNAPLPDDLKQ